MRLQFERVDSFGGLAPAATLRGPVGANDFHSHTTCECGFTRLVVAASASKLRLIAAGECNAGGIRTVDFNFDVVGLPEGPAGPGNWLFWGAYVVNANTEHPEQAWQLVRRTAIEIERAT